MNSKAASSILLLLLACVILIGGLAVALFWIFFMAESLGGINWLSASLGMLIFSPFVLLYIFVFSRGQGRPVKRRRRLVVGVYLALVGVLALESVYDSVLPQDVPTQWRLFLLPMITILAVLLILRCPPKTKAEIDKSSNER